MSRAARQGRKPDTVEVTATEVMTFRIDGEIAIVSIDSPPVNALGAAVRQGIQQGLAQAMADPEVAAVVLICEGRTFFAGADIREIGKPMVEPNLRQLQTQFEAIDKPVIAAMHGSALGGGLELAMAAHYRVAVPSARLGFPEVKLGLLPGAGGTQRLPRLVGIEAALTMMTEGEPIDAAHAQRIGLIDALVEEGGLLAGAVAFARRKLAEGAQPVRTRDREDRLAEARARRDSVDALFADIRTRHQGFLAAENIVEAAAHALTTPFDEGLAAEAALFETLKASDQSAALRYAFFAERQAGKPSGAAVKPEIRSIRSLAVAGDGPLARQVAEAARSAGLAVEGERGFEALLLTDPAMPKAQLDPLLARASAADAIVMVPAASRDSFALPQERRAVAVEFGQNPGCSGLMEILAEGQEDATIAGMVELARKLQRIGVPSAAGVDSACQRMRDARDRHLLALSAGGITPAAIHAALASAGFAADRSFAFAAEVSPAGLALTDEALVRSVRLAILNAAARLADAGAVTHLSDLDVIAVHGLGWPRYEGGPLFWADRAGLAALVPELQRLEAQFGEAFEPAAGLVDRAGENSRFVAG